LKKRDSVIVEEEGRDIRSTTGQEEYDM